jgi:hypothetical protein
LGRLRAGLGRRKAGRREGRKRGKKGGRKNFRKEGREERAGKFDEAGQR